MPAYVFSCTACGGSAEHQFPIGTARRVMACTSCGALARLVIGAGVNIAPSALETKGADVRAIDDKEAGWHKDMPAYYRMRHRGMQPKGIDGSAALEDKANDQMDVDFHHLYSKDVTRERVIDAQEQAKEIMATGVPV